MSPTLEIRNTLFTTAKLNEIARQDGPCITLLIPDRHPGSQEGSRAVLVRGMARSVAEMVATQQLDPAIIQPIEDFASKMEEDKGGPGIALFRSPNYFNVVTAPGIAKGSVTLSRHFHLAPLVMSVSVPQDFYVLGLNRKNLFLYRYSHQNVEKVDFPAQIPSNMEAALAFDQPDHRLENSSAAGRSTGAMTSVRFGTLSDREAAREYLQHYFEVVNRGLKQWLPGTPLLLAGVHEEVATFRRVARNEGLLHPEIQGNIEFLSITDMAERAREAAVAHYRWLGEAVLAKFREMPDRRRTRSTARAVLNAASAGRVHQLCVAEGADVRGSLKSQGGFENEDLVNAAVVETLRNGGEVFMLPEATMAEAAPLAAILRF